MLHASYMRTYYTTHFNNGTKWTMKTEQEPQSEHKTLITPLSPLSSNTKWVYNYEIGCMSLTDRLCSVQFRWSWECPSCPQLQQWRCPMLWGATEALCGGGLIWDWMTCQKKITRRLQRSVGRSPLEMVVMTRSYSGTYVPHKHVRYVCSRVASSHDDHFHVRYVCSRVASSHDDHFQGASPHTAL